MTTEYANRGRKFMKIAHALPMQVPQTNISNWLAAAKISFIFCVFELTISAKKTPVPEPLSL